MMTSARRLDGTGLLLVHSVESLPSLAARGLPPASHGPQCAAALHFRNCNLQHLAAPCIPGQPLPVQARSGLAIGITAHKVNKGVPAVTAGFDIGWNMQSIETTLAQLLQVRIHFVVARSAGQVAQHHRSDLLPLPRLDLLLLLLLLLQVHRTRYPRHRLHLLSATLRHRPPAGPRNLRAEFQERVADHSGHAGDEKETTMAEQQSNP
mmetsp:Transcript_48319/g.105190  ORF Transcript_48319/g.105190 Transcript_48319/m.105190 type:complete len:208 (+) Transcript_48319:597-1220(+)